MHPFVHAAANPDALALIVAETGETRTYGELEAGSNRVAHFARSRGLGHDDVIAIMLENRPEYYDLVWGAQRAGLRYVCISSKLTADETDYILENSGAKLFVLSASLAGLAAQLSTGIERYSLGGPVAGYAPLEDALAAMPATPVADERAGVDMLYSSGTTGRPKGVRIPLPVDPALDAPNPLLMLTGHLYGFNPASVYLSPAPLYHAAPLRFSMTIHRFGGTVVMMKKFDPEGVLRAIDRYKITCGQFVPTHFVRMLKLPEDVRAQYDLSTMKSAIHAAAPCPIPVKEAMIGWWGEVIHEYYAGSESNGMTYISSADWLTHKGSVGRPIMGVPHIMSDDGETEMPQGQEGVVYFESELVFEYHGDAEKTKGSRNSKGWSTLGDVGYLDPEGYLYLTDRKSFMIISGGVNIYPQEIENHLVTHPKVQDVAVIGGPHEEMGEEVIAVVQPIDMADAGDALRDDLTAYAREKLSGVKIPRRIDFLAELPRHDTGKLYKRLLRDQYWERAKNG
jgi:acyl-CoA synthetase (AMP-forming)/AMP-acid ligase II